MELHWKAGRIVLPTPLFAISVDRHYCVF